MSQRDHYPHAAGVVMVWFGGLVLVSDLPAVVYRLVTGAAATPVWLPFVLLAAILAILGVAMGSPAVSHLRGYLISLTALAAGYLVESIVEHSSVWISWNRGLPASTSFVLVNAMKIIPVSTLALSLLGSRLTRADVFLKIGTLGAPVFQRGHRASVSWAAVLPIAILVSVGPVVANVVAARHPDFGVAPRLLTLAPLIVAGAAVNTFAEEFLFRQVLLARLIPIVGTGQAVSLTALRFGIGHWFGNPSGPTGVMLATIFGWIVGHSMVDTRGSAWAWLVHLVNDLVIFALIALTTARWV